MKLFYAKGTNFGDVLNQWLWSRLIGDILDEDDSEIFVGFGTIINTYRLDRFRSKMKLLFGGGCGYYPPVSLDDTFKVYCVRGPLSARTLGLPGNFAVTDSAVLINQLVEESHGKNYTFGVMPHHNNLMKPMLRVSAGELGFQYIEPDVSAGNSIEKILEDISSCEILIAEALHGAIIADALNVSWIPAMFNYQILEFKWIDWARSLGLKDPFSRMQKLRGSVFSILRKSSKAMRRKSAYLSLVSQNSLEKMLRRYSRMQPVLSNRSVLSQKTEILLNLLDNLRKDVSG